MLRQRWSTLWGFIFILALGFFLSSGFAIRSSVAASFATSQQIRETRTLLFSVIKAQLDEETGLRGYAGTRDRLFLQPYTVAHEALPSELARLQVALDALHLPDASAAAQDASLINVRWLSTVATPVLRRPQVDIAIQKAGKVLVDRFRSDASRIDQSLGDLNRAARKDFDTALARISVLIAGTALFLFAAGAVFATAQSRAWQTLERERAQSEEGRQRENVLFGAYEAEKRIADVLQEAISQRDLPALPSMHFSATYTPATEETKVGGDWYDAFELSSERILFTIGDIAGHGIEAAVGMSRVRNAVLSAALLERDPAAILSRVNDEISRDEVAQIVTAVVGMADSKTYEFEYASAGHPPPILLEPGRAPKLLEFGSLPLGVGLKSEYTTHRVQSVPGAMLVLYTDGAIEHSRDVIEGERVLLAAIASIAAHPSVDPATAIYHAIFEGKSVGDDVAILTVGFTANQAAGFTLSAEDATSSFTSMLSRVPQLPASILDRSALRQTPGQSTEGRHHDTALNT